MFTTKWTDEKIRILVERFKDTGNRELAGILRLHERTVERKAMELGLKKDPKYIADVSKKGLMEIEYRRMMGQKMGPPKGLRCNPKGEFKKGHKEDVVTRAKRIAAIRATAEREKLLVKMGKKTKTRWAKTNG